MSYDDALSHHLQRMLMADVGLSWEDAQFDGDGEICFTDAHGRMVTALILAVDGNVWARVWVLAASGLKRSAKLLREVNELNLSLLGSRALLTPDGRLIIAAEVALESVEETELGRIIEVLSDSAERSGPMIQMVFGTVVPPRENEDVDS